ncbi:hypothetical protein [Iningainema tapete]|uniref:Uncharacterized protein n=1 Tax=Iningainema tapete BLCC-T55 TaxID=2748662 RepID=A0A8J6XAF7_9CYAN|nr:hypothetical protein [Iningainema tapete]MBD2771185.1 hypothetical protein [Iningainema tapete BLCC-T55]
MPPELDSTTNPNPDNKQFSDEEIAKILSTAKATRKERDDVAARAKELEDSNKQLQAQLEQIKTIDPERYKELEDLAANLEERKLEEQQKFNELKERWTGERTTLQQQNQQLQEELKQTRIINDLEKAFYALGGKTGKDDFGCSYFDLIRDRAMSFLQLGEDGKLRVLDPRDGTRMLGDKGTPLTVEDLMLKLRSSGPTAALFDPVGNGAGGGMQPSHPAGLAATREQVMGITNRAERLARIRELGIK